MLLHLGAFILSNSQRIISKLVTAIDGFNGDIVYYTDKDSIYLEKKRVLEQESFLGKEMVQARNVYGDRGTFHGLFGATKVTFCLILKEYRNMEKDN